MSKSRKENNESKLNKNKPGRRSAHFAIASFPTDK
jgi:hypothetical protein